MKTTTPAKSIPDRLVLPRYMVMVCVSALMQPSPVQISMKVLRVLRKSHRDDNNWTSIFLCSMAQADEWKLL